MLDLHCWCPWCSHNPVVFLNMNHDMTSTNHTVLCDLPYHKYTDDSILFLANNKPLDHFFLPLGHNKVVAPNKSIYWRFHCQCCSNNYMLRCILHFRINHNLLCYLFEEFFLCNHQDNNCYLSHKNNHQLGWDLPPLFLV